MRGLLVRSACRVLGNLPRSIGGVAATRTMSAWVQLPAPWQVRVPVSVGLVFWVRSLPAVPAVAEGELQGAERPGGQGLALAYGNADPGLARNDEGFFTDPAAWTEQMAPQIAKAEGIDHLTDRHWQVIRFMRHEYQAKGTGPTVRVLGKGHGNLPSDPGGSDAAAWLGDTGDLGRDLGRPLGKSW